MTGVIAGVTGVVAEMTGEVVETSPVLAERTRLPRLRSLVMGGGATVALAALVTLVLPNVGADAPSAPGHAPALQLPEAATAVVPYQWGHRAVTHRPAKHKAAKHKAAKHKAVAEPAVPTLPLHTNNAGSRDFAGAGAVPAPNGSQVVSNVQDGGNTNANVDTHLRANASSVTTANKHVNSNSSVNVSNNTTQKLTSGSVKNSSSVHSSVKVSRTSRHSQSEG